MTIDQANSILLKHNAKIIGGIFNHRSGVVEYMISLLGTDQTFMVTDIELKQYCKGLYKLPQLHINEN